MASPRNVADASKQVRERPEIVLPLQHDFSFVRYCSLRGRSRTCFIFASQNSSANRPEGAWLPGWSREEIATFHRSEEEFQVPTNTARYPSKGLANIVRNGCRGFHSTFLQPSLMSVPISFTMNVHRSFRSIRK